MNDEIFNQIQSYEKRVFFFVEEHNWTKANEYAEKILDIQPENATAYLAKLLIDYHCSCITDLSKQKNSFEENINYKRIIQFGDKVVVDKINKELQKIKKKQEQRRSEIETKVNILKNKSKSTLKVLLPFCICCVIIVSVISNFILPNIKYNKAVNLYESGKYEEAYDIFSEIGNFKDSLTIRNEILKILKEKNYITYKGLFIKLPNSDSYTAKVLNEKIYLSGEINFSINEFLSYVYAPSGKSFYATGWAKSNGNSSFVIKDYATVHTLYWLDDTGRTETVDLQFYRYSGIYEARYACKDGRWPMYFTGTKGLSPRISNDGSATYKFNIGETTIIGQYQSPNTTVEIVVVRQ